MGAARNTGPTSILRAMAQLGEHHVGEKRGAFFADVSCVLEGASPPENPIYAR